MSETPHRPPTRPAFGPFSGRQLATIAAAIAASALLLLGLTTPLAGGPTATISPAPGATAFLIGSPTAGLQVGDRAPELAGESDGKQVELTDLDGNPVRLADLRGRPVWLNFFATWCPPCQEETPVLRALDEKYRDKGLTLVAVSVQESSPDDVRAYANTYGLDYTIAFDATSAIFRTYRAFALPTHVFIDRDGIIREVWRGPLTMVEAERRVTALLAAE